MTDKHERDVHTSGQLVLDGPDEFGDYTILRGNEALAIAAVISNMRPARVTAANARRFVAAWNACQGIETEALEKGITIQNERKNLELAKDYADTAARADEAEALLKFVDERLTEINPSNHNHEDVCDLNARNVEVVLAVSAFLEARKP